MENQMVVFNLADEEYGVDITAVDSIVKAQRVTRIPYAPDFVEGIANLRGDILPVINLRKRFGLPTAAPRSPHEGRIIIVEVNKLRVGMMVDAVTEVLRVADEDIQPPSPLIITAQSHFITGIARLSGDRLVIRLDLSRVLSGDEQAELRTLLQEQAPTSLTGQAA